MSEDVVSLPEDQMKQENTDENTRLWKGEAPVCKSQRRRESELAAVCNLIPSTALHCLLPVLPSPQIRMNGHAKEKKKTCADTKTHTDKYAAAAAAGTEGCIIMAIRHRHRNKTPCRKKRHKRGEMLFLALLLGSHVLQEQE